MVSLPNIYKSKHAKYFVLIPVIMFIFGVYFATHITLDSTLAGGVSVTIQSHLNISNQALASKITSVMHVSNPAIESSPGGLQITLPLNTSIASAEQELIAVYAFNQNYSSSQLNITSYSIGLQNTPSNQTLAAGLAAAKIDANTSMSELKSHLSAELAYVAPFTGPVSFNQSSQNGAALSTLGQTTYANASAVYQNRVVSQLQSIIPFSTYSYQQLTPTLGNYFLGQLTDVIIIAFILISIVVFFIFRSVAPAFAVIFGAANDLIVALGAMGLFGIPLGIASIGALLMLIGYSIDTDILTAVRIMKRHEGTPEDRAYASMKTGLTMTATAIVSFGVLFAVSLFAYVPTYYEISAVLLCGFVGDIFTTWLGNASLVLLFKNRKDKKGIR